MNYKALNKFCEGLPATSYVRQWGESHVWKVGGKVFAIGGWEDGGRDDSAAPAFTFKVSEMAYEMLKDEEGLRPAPYFASRGMKWIQHHGKPGLRDAELKKYLRDSHRLAALGLSKKKRRDLGLAKDS